MPCTRPSTEEHTVNQQSEATVCKNSRGVAGLLRVSCCVLLEMQCECMCVPPARVVDQAARDVRCFSSSPHNTSGVVRSAVSVSAAQRLWLIPM